MLELKFPWPPKELSPNKRLHWAKVAKVKKQYRQACYLLTKQAGEKLQGKLSVDIEFVVPDKRNRDDDNMIASFKAGRDGVAEALGVDDVYFNTTYRVNREPIKGGAVIVKIRSM